MKIFDVKDLDKYVSPLTPADFAGVDVYSICKAKNLRSNHICFISGAKPLAELMSSLDSGNRTSLSEVIFIIDKKYFNKKNEDFDFIPKSNITLTDNFDLVMCLISKFFFDLKYDDSQYLLDGRQTGDTKICPSARIAQNVYIGENVDIGSDVIIMPGCVVMGNVKIANNTTIYPNCVLYPETRVGSNCKIHAGSVIGSDGFGYNYMQGQHRKIWHIGGVSIGDCVEIGSNCSVDRGTFDDTIIEDECKLDNLVHIAHNCHLKTGVIVCAQSGLAGSVTVGKFSAMSGHVAVAPGIEIGDQCEVVGHSAVFENVQSGTRLAGSPARPMKEWLRTIAALRRLTKK
jgi:UDP-3-O-[3-hydroxymyristoyl] glucosamine N-acyltransferase